MKWYHGLIIVLLVVGIYFLTNPVKPAQVTKIDTVTVYDTIIFDTVIYQPKIVERIKRDTVLILDSVNIYRDTLFYKNFDLAYSATGYLDSISFDFTNYNPTKIITKTISPEGWYVGAQYGQGFNVGASYLKGRWLFGVNVGQSSNISVKLKL